MVVDGDGGGGDVRRVVYREEREEERYVIRSITFQDQVSVSFNQNALKHTF